MWRFATAGLDPVFWLHHCTIDRYWEVRGHATDPSGWAAVVFDFRTVAGTVRVDSDGCVDTVGRLGYRYDDVTPPAAPTAGQEVRARRFALMAEEPAPEMPPEVVGRRGAVPLEGRRADAPMQVGTASDLFWTARRGETEPRRVFLAVEDITGDANPGISYAVYIGRSTDDTRMAGLISFFGIEGSRGGGHPLGFAFDVTDIVRSMRDEDAWDPADLHVIFEPVWPVHDDASSRVEEVAPVEVGSVSVVYQ
jgi:tyrosinase